MSSFTYIPTQTVTNEFSTLTDQTAATLFVHFKTPRQKNLMSDFRDRSYTGSRVRNSWPTLFYNDLFCAAAK